MSYDTSALFGLESYLTLKCVRISDTISDRSSILSTQLPGLDFISPQKSGDNGGDNGDYSSCMAAVCQLKDIDSFIANVTVPPPPSSSSTAAAPSSSVGNSLAVGNHPELLSKASQRLFRDAVASATAGNSLRWRRRSGHRASPCLSPRGLMCRQSGRHAGCHRPSPARSPYSDRRLRRWGR